PWRSAIRSAPREVASSGRWCTSCAGTAAASGWPRSAPAVGRATRSCSKSRTIGRGASTPRKTALLRGKVVVSAGPKKGAHRGNLASPCLRDPFRAQRGNTGVREQEGPMRRLVLIALAALILPSVALAAGPSYVAQGGLGILA